MTDWDHEVDVVVLGSGGAGLTAALDRRGQRRLGGGVREGRDGGRHDRGFRRHRLDPGAQPVVRRRADGRGRDGAICAHSRSASWTTTWSRRSCVPVQRCSTSSRPTANLQFEVAEGFPDYKPELPGGTPGRRAVAECQAVRPGPGSANGATAITSFPADFSNVGIDAETRARIHASVDDESGDYCVAGTALIAGLLKGLLDLGVVPHTNARAVELFADALGITGVRITHGDKDVQRSRPPWRGAGYRRVRMGPEAGRSLSARSDARRGLTAEQHRRRLAHGHGTRRRSGQHGRGVVGTDRRSCRATRSRAIREAAVFGSNGLGRGASSSTGQASGSSTRPASTTRWRARSISSTPSGATRTIRRGSSSTHSISSGTDSSGSCLKKRPRTGSRHLAISTELGEKTGIDADGLAATLAAWNDNVGHEHDPDFGRGASAYDGYWGDDSAATPAGKTLGPIDTAPYYAVPVSIGAMGTKGGPRTDRDGRVLHVTGAAIPGLFAAGNAMAGATGKAYGGAGGTLGPAMVFGYRAGLAVSART